MNEADHAFAGLNDIMDRLAETITEETTHARAGRLKAAAELTESKLELARLYSAESQRMKDGPRPCAARCAR